MALGVLELVDVADDFVVKLDELLEEVFNLAFALDETTVFLIEVVDVPHSVLVEFNSILVFAILANHGHVVVVGPDHFEDFADLLSDVFCVEDVAVALVTVESSKTFQDPLGL